jgi:drug/metabolite transporter (DMT)-like permease
LKKGNFFGFSAIIIWSTLALFTVLTKNIPPFLLLSISFAIASFLGIVWMFLAKESIKVLKQPWYVWIVGVGGLFGYHLFYFLALRNAPAVEANLINYLWPLLIVLFSAFLPNERLKWYHAVGAILGFSGAILLVTRGGFLVQSEFILGYFYALLCALTWSTYSVISRLFGLVPTFAVTGFCVAVALLSFTVYLGFEPSYALSPNEWLAALALGLGPVGGAFYLWDVGMKKGDIKLLGTLSYAIPLLSTFLLILFNLAQSSFVVWAAAALIIAGSIVSSLKYWKKSA